MLLQTVRPNIVQAIRAYRVEDLMTAAESAGQHFLYANLTEAQSKQDVLDKIAESFLFPAHFGKNLDALFDCMTDLVHRAGSQPGFVVGWVASCVFVYSALFGVGLLLMGRTSQAAFATVLLVVSGVVMWRSVSRMWAQ